MRMLLILVMIAGCLLSPLVMAEDVDNRCLQSLPVKKGRTVELDNARHDCAIVENYRAGLYQQIEEMNSNNDANALASANKTLAAMKQEVAKMESNNAGPGLGDVVGHFLATVGLAACAETAGTGCVLAAIGKIMQTVQTIQTATEAAERKSAAAALRKQVQTAEQQLGQIGAAGIAKRRENTVEEFNDLCRRINDSCL